MKRILSLILHVLVVVFLCSTHVHAITFVNPQPGENIHGLTTRIGTEVDIIASKACDIESILDTIDLSSSDALICSKLEVIESKIDAGASICDEILQVLGCEEVINLQDVLDIGTYVITQAGRYCFVGVDVSITNTLAIAIDVQVDDVVLNFDNLKVDGNNITNVFMNIDNRRNVTIEGGTFTNFNSDVFFVDNSTNVTIKDSRIINNDTAVFVNDSEKVAIEGLDVCNTTSAGIIIVNTKDTIIKETLLINDSSVTVTVQVAIDIVGSNDVLIDDVRVINYFDGMSFESTTNVICTNCLAKENVNDGYIIPGPTTKDIIFDFCTAMDNEATGFNINGCNITLKNCCSMMNDTGFKCDDDTAAVLIDGCSALANTIGICIEDNAYQVCIVDSYFHASIEVDIKGTTTTTIHANEKIIQSILIGPVRQVLDQTNFDTNQTFTIRVPGVYIIAEDIIWTNTTEYAIVVDADNVCVDLGKNTMDGSNLGFGFICAEGVFNYTLQNGFLQNFRDTAIKTTLSDKTNYQNLCAFMDGNNVPILWVRESTRTIIEKCVCTNMNGGCFRCEDCECVTMQDNKGTTGTSNADIVAELRNVRAATVQNTVAGVVGTAIGLAATAASTAIALKANKVTGAVQAAQTGTGILADAASNVSMDGNQLSNLANGVVADTASNILSKANEMSDMSGPAKQLTDTDNFSSNDDTSMQTNGHTKATNCNNLLEDGCVALDSMGGGPDWEFDLVNNALMREIKSIGGEGDSFFAQNSDGLLIEDFVSQDAGGSGINTVDTDNLTVRDADIIKPGDTGVKSSGGSNQTFKNGSVQNPTNDGISFDNLEDLIIEDWDVDDAVQGYFFSAIDGLSADNILSKNTTGDGMDMLDVWRGKLNALEIQDADGSGLNISNSSDILVEGLQGQDIVGPLIDLVDSTDVNLNDVVGQDVGMMVDAVRPNNISGDGFSGRMIDGAAVRTVDGTGHNSWYDHDYSDIAGDVFNSTNDENFDIDNARADNVGGDFFDGNGTTRSQISDSSLVNGGGDFIKAFDVSQLEAIRNQAQAIAGSFLDADTVESIFVNEAEVTSAGANFAKVAGGIELLLRDLTAQGIAGDMVDIEGFVELAIERVFGNDIGVNGIVTRDGAQLVIDGLNITGINGDGWIHQNVPNTKGSNISIANVIGTVAKFIL